LVKLCTCPSIRLFAAALATIEWVDINEVSHINSYAKELLKKILLLSPMLMMACMKSYNHFVGIRMCGILTVTLDGTKDDWLEIQTQLEKFEEWDHTTRKGHLMLRRVTRKHIAAFDREVDIDF
jgi:hypothetical protein